MDCSLSSINEELRVVKRSKREVSSREKDNLLKGARDKPLQK